MQSRLHRRQGFWFLALCGLLLFVPTIHAQDPLSPDAPVTIEKVALFKNGLGYFNASAVLPDGATSVRLGQLPVPAYGTFWVGYPKDVKLQSLITGMEDYDEHQTAQSIADMLRANAGKRVKLRLANEGSELIQGLLVVPDRDANPVPEHNPYFMGGRPAGPANAPYVPNPGSGNLILVQTDNATFAINPKSVLSVSFDGADAATDVPVHRKRPAIRAELAEPAAGQKVAISYLARGITWSPAYLIDLSDPETAHLSARALVINEVADLDNVELELITGFPNIRFSDVISPVAQSQRLADFLQALLNGASTSNQGRNVMAQQAIATNVLFNSDFAFNSPNAVPLPSYSTAAQGTVSEDLFLYPVNRLTLKQGETAWIPLFTADVPYEHIYTWKIEDFLDAEGRYRNQPESPDGVMAEEVWHSCRITNALDMPLTTAATEFVTKGAFTGQDICYYTAPGAKTTIRINRAMNVVAEQSEIETDRVMNASTFHGYAYDLVTLHGDLRVRNRQDKSANLEITKELSGKVLQSEPSAKDVSTGKGLKQTNPKHVLTWEIELKPGEEKNLSYDYQVYVRK